MYALEQEVYALVLSSGKDDKLKLSLNYQLLLAPQNRKNNNKKWTESDDHLIYHDKLA